MTHRSGALFQPAPLSVSLRPRSLSASGPALCQPPAPALCQPPAPLSVSLRPRSLSASGDSRNNRQGLAVGDRGGQPIEKPDIFIVQEHIDEPAKPSAVVEESVGTPCMGTLERLEHLADRRTLDGYL